MATRLALPRRAVDSEVGDLLKRLYVVEEEGDRIYHIRRQAHTAYEDGSAKVYFGAAKDDQRRKKESTSKN